MDISVLIATYNGATTLRTTLQSFVDTDTSDLEWELMICINNSTDNTEEVIAEFSDRLPVKVFHQSKQGISPSFNLLMDNAQGELVAFTADDVIVADNWLKKGMAIAAEKTEYGMIGGRITAFYGEHKKDWVDRFNFSHVAYANTPEQFSYGEVGPGSIFGACLIIRREVLETGVRYDENIGPNGKNYIMGSETDYLTRVAALGYKCWFNQDFNIRHIISPSQLEFSWLEKRAYRYGLSMYHKEKANNFADTKVLFGVPVWRINLFVSSWLKTKFGSKQDPEYANRIWEVGFFRGYMHSKNHH